MRHYIFSMLIIFPIHCFAGAWGVGSFENDSALDWVYELETASSVGFLGHTFSNIQGSQYLEVDACSAVLAAAEIVASINSRSFSHLPSDVLSWAKKHSEEVTQALKSSATKAVSQCADGKKSEVSQLWEESAPKEWASYILDLQSRLK